MARFYYSDSVAEFLGKTPQEILGAINATALGAEPAQESAWLVQINVLQSELRAFAGRGTIFFEFAVPRIGRRIDIVLLLESVVFVVEFKVGEEQFRRAAIEQVWDYALDLKNFHDTSHTARIVPVLVATAATAQPIRPQFSPHDDDVLAPVLVAPAQLGYALKQIVDIPVISPADPVLWHAGRYHPTPTIIEAARALYAGHSVQEISMSGAEAKNLGQTSDAVIEVVHEARRGRKKIVCFVTGVPGAGKTLVGLNISTTPMADEEGRAVYLSGNGPLVKVLQEVLASDRCESQRGTPKAVSKSEARRAVASFIQNVHHFRDAYIEDRTAPHNHISIFDEAQRAWDRDETERFMRQKKGIANFAMSEPEFLISCMDRHDWAVVVCLVGGGQEINRGEAGISGWIGALTDKFPQWHVRMSPQLDDLEYAAGAALEVLRGRKNVGTNPALHLATSMRSFRATGLSAVVKSLLDLDVPGARSLVRALCGRYPFVLTRSLDAAKHWVRQQARGSERFGMMVSSQAQRLKPLAIDVRVATNPVHWFLKGADDVRSSMYLEDAATEFDVQGLELDWACVVWDADFRFTRNGWAHSSFRGNRWEKISKLERQGYLKNAYRVLLTRARQGLVIVVPQGDPTDPTRTPAMYDGTYGYLASLGLSTI
jgi:hypothetical protein